MYNLRKSFFLISLSLFLVTGCEQPRQSGDLETTVAEINEKCPTMIDEETQFNGVELHENTLTYNFTLVNARASAMDTTAFRVAMWPGILSNIKVSREMESLRNDGISFYYVYRDKYNKPVYTFSVNPVHYQ